MINNILDNKYFVFSLLILTSFIVYSFSFSAPFYLDDFNLIQDNLDLRKNTVDHFIGEPRFIGFLTFFYNYKLNFSTIEQLHFTNTLIHTLNGFLVYCFVYLLSKTPNVKKSEFGNYIKFITFFAALLFIIHPLHTQAVTYLIQRFTLLATLFYISSICCYLLFRLSKSIPVKIIFVSLTIIFAMSAWFSKQNAASLPLIFLLVELLLFNSLKIKKILFINSLLVIFLAIYWLFIPTSFFELLESLDAASRETLAISRFNYFTAQLNIIWIYFAKFIVPFNLRLEYGYTINSFPTLFSVLAGIAHFLLIYLSYKLRKTHIAFSFGIFFYYIAHLVESSIIPIRDLAFEHRAYLPNIGLIISLLWATIYLIKRWKLSNLQIITISSIILIGLSTSAIYRNMQWQDRIAFYKNEYQLDPNNLRIAGNLAKSYLDSGNKHEGFKYLNKAIALSGNNMREDVANNYLAMAIDSGDYTNAQIIADKILPSITKSKMRSQIYLNIGVLNLRNKNLDIAEDYFKKSLQQSKYEPDAHYALAIVFLEKKQYNKARGELVKLLKIKPNHKKANELFGKFVKKRN